ncbi:MAG: class I SAM-dependent methyltransferase [Myxococcota bacterium]|nr:class I SAM-dependent methyltransferase [Myxococcota bacterium]
MSDETATGAARPAPEDVEHCPCPLCHANDALPSPYRSDPFAVVRCARCRLWYLSPRLPKARMQALYERGDYYAGGETGYADYPGQEESLRATFRRLLAALARRGLTGGSLLEVGCGYGYFLAEAEAFFERREGTEFAPEAIERARRHADRIHPGGPEVLPDARFDCIVAIQVIEHVYEPVGFLRGLLRSLRPGGAIVLAAPDMGSFWRHLSQSRWPSFKYPEHVAFYDGATLRALMAGVGVTGLERIPYPHAFPLREVCRKLRLPAVAALARGYLWIPRTTVAIAGRLPGAFAFGDVPREAMVRVSRGRP